MPRLQKLAEKYKGRSDVQFITLNMDDNPGLIEPYMKEHQLSLIVLPAYSYVTDTLKVFEIPQNWIVDSHGVVRLKGTGYDSTEKWEMRMAEAIEKKLPGITRSSWKQPKCLVNARDLSDVRILAVVCVWARCSVARSNAVTRITTEASAAGPFLVR